MLPLVVEIIALGGLRSANMNGPFFMERTPRVSRLLKGILLGRPSFKYFFPCIPFAGRVRVSSTMHPSMVEIMALSELQTGDPSEALVPFIGSRREVHWGPSSYS
jgi:hypothetical protein